MGVVREFARGRSTGSSASSSWRRGPAAGRRLTHQVRIAAGGSLGRTLAAVEFGVRGRKGDRPGLSADRRRPDRQARPRPGRSTRSRPPAALAASRARRLERWLDALGARGVRPRRGRAVRRLPRAGPAAGGRADPARWPWPGGSASTPTRSSPPASTAASDGVLILLWDILCPVCRIPSQVIDTLRALREHGHCEACQLDFDLDFANSVELIFRVHPEIRETDVAHLLRRRARRTRRTSSAQARVGPGERVVLDLALRGRLVPAPGAATARTRSTSGSSRRRRPDAGTSTWAGGPAPDLPRTLRAGGAGPRPGQRRTTASCSSGSSGSPRATTP